jgi:hypothetical protein
MLCLCAYWVSMIPMKPKTLQLSFCNSGPSGPHSIQWFVRTGGSVIRHDPGPTTQLSVNPSSSRSAPTIYLGSLSPQAVGTCAEGKLHPATVLGEVLLANSHFNSHFNGNFCIYIYLCVCVCMYMYVYTYEYIYIYTYMIMYAYTYVCVCMCMCVYVAYACMYACMPVCLYACMYVCM